MENSLLGITYRIAKSTRDPNELRLFQQYFPWPQFTKISITKRQKGFLFLPGGAAAALNSHLVAAAHSLWSVARRDTRYPSCRPAIPLQYSSVPSPSTRRTTLSIAPLPACGGSSPMSFFDWLQKGRAAQLENTCSVDSFEYSYILISHLLHPHVVQFVWCKWSLKSLVQFPLICCFFSLLARV